MRFEERTQIIGDLEDINEWCLEDSECALDISKNSADHYVEGEDLVAAILAAKASRVDSDDLSMDPPSGVSTDEGLFGCKSDCSSIVSTSSNISMEDMTKATSYIDLTDADKNDGSENIDDDKSTSI